MHIKRSMFCVEKSGYDFFGVYLGVKTCAVFLCFAVIVRVRVNYFNFFVLFDTHCSLRHSLVSVTGFYTEDEPFSAN